MCLIGRVGIEKHTTHNQPSGRCLSRAKPQKVGQSPGPASNQTVIFAKPPFEGFLSYPQVVHNLSGFDGKVQ